MYKRILNLCEKKGISIYKMCKESGVKLQSLTELKSGRAKSLSSANISKIASYFGVSSDYILDSNDSALATYGNIFSIKTKKVPLLGDIACGEPIYAEEQHGEYVLAADGLNADFCLRAKGDSMIGARIFDGDIVFCERCDTVDNGQVAVVIIEDEATLKRVYYYPESGKLVLNPENPAYEPLVYLGEELNQIRILGRAVAYQSYIR